MCSLCILNKLEFEIKKGVGIDLGNKSMETRKHSGWLEIAYQNLMPTFVIHFLIRLANHKF